MDVSEQLYPQPRFWKWSSDLLPLYALYLMRNALQNRTLRAYWRFFHATPRFPRIFPRSARVWGGSIRMLHYAEAVRTVAVCHLTMQKSHLNDASLRTQSRILPSSHLTYCRKSTLSPSYSLRHITSTPSSLNIKCCDRVTMTFPKWTVSQAPPFSATGIKSEISIMWLYSYSLSDILNP